MRLTEAFAAATLDEIKTALDGGTLVLYSTGRPPSADHAITRSSKLASFTFASPAFAADEAEGVLKPQFTEAVLASNVGTPGFARALKADGVVVADFSVGPGGEVKLDAVAAVAGFPISVTAIKTSLPAETVEWATTPAGHVYVTNSDNPYRRLSVRG